MLRDEPTPRRIDGIVLWGAVAATDGALRVAGDVVSGHVFAEVGHPYFGVVDGRPPLPDDLSRTGIAAPVWKAALASVHARSSLSAGLLEHGADPEAVAAFARAAVVDTVDRLLENTRAGLTVVARRHPFGSEFRFLAAEGAPHLGDPVTGFRSIEAQRLLDMVRPSRLDLGRRRPVLGRSGVDDDDRVGRSAYALVSDLRAGAEEGQARRWARRRRRR